MPEGFLIPAQWIDCKQSVLREGWYEWCKWSILTGLLFLTTQQYSQWQIPDCGASWRWSSELGICLLKHRGSGSRYSGSFPGEGSRGHQPVRDSFSGRWRERRKKGSMTLPASTFNTGIGCKIDISLCGNLLPDTVLLFSREKHFFPLPLIANSQSDCWTENSLKLPLVYPKTQKWILEFVSSGSVVTSWYFYPEVTQPLGLWSLRPLVSYHRAAEQVKDGGPVVRWLAQGYLLR